MPSHTLETDLQGLTAETYLRHAKKTVQSLGWQLSDISSTGMIAESPMSWAKNTWGEVITINIENEQVILSSKSKGNTLFDFGRNKKNLQKFLDNFELVKQQPETEADKQTFTAIATAFEEQRNAEPPVAPLKWWQYFVPRKDFTVTPILLLINIALFVAFVASGGNAFAPSVESLIEWGANVKYLTSGNHESWRLVTCMFLHIGILHLALNMYALLYIGLYVEPLLGSARFAACYIATGIFASLASLWWHDNTASAGASGAIFGMYGVFLALLTTNMVPTGMRNALMGSIMIFIVYNLFNGLRGGVDNAAHIGGLVSGIIIGYLVYIFSRSKAIKNNLAQAAVVMLIAIAIPALTISGIRDPYAEFTKSLEGFDKYEEEALKFYALPASTTEASQISFLNETAIPNWNKCKEKLAALQKIKMPADLQRRADLLNEYVDLRIRLSKTEIKKLEDQTDKYDEDINKINREIERIITDLNGPSQ